MSEDEKPEETIPAEDPPQ